MPRCKETRPKKERKKSYVFFPGNWKQSLKYISLDTQRNFSESTIFEEEQATEEETSKVVKLNYHQNENIARGETSQSIIPFHFFDYFNFFSQENLYQKITFITK